MHDSTSRVIPGLSAPGIHPTAILAFGVRLGANVSIGPYAVIHPGVELGDDSFVGSHCELGVPAGGALPQNEPQALRIGPHATIRSGSVLYAGSEFGPQFECGHRVTIREKTRGGVNLRVGTLTDIQGDCRFGDYVRLHGNVQVGKSTEIGNFVWVSPYVVLTNDPHPPSNHSIGVRLDDYAVVGAHTVVLPGVHLAAHAVVGAGSLVKESVPEGMLVGGHPARVLCKAAILRDRLDPRRKAYPWPENFERGMPWQGLGYDAWVRERDASAREQ